MNASKSVRSFTNNMHFSKELGVMPRSQRPSKSVSRYLTLGQILKPTLINYFSQSKVKEIVLDVDHDQHMVDRLMEIKSTIEKTIGECFLMEKILPSSTSSSQRSATAASFSNTHRSLKVIDSNFTNSMHVAFSSAFKARPLVPAEQIARTIDLEMRRGQRKSSEREYTARLKAILSLYRYSEDKDVFRTFYHRALSKRLLLERSASDDEEKRMIKFLVKGEHCSVF